MEFLLDWEMKHGNHWLKVIALLRMCKFYSFSYLLLHCGVDSGCVCECMHMRAVEGKAAREEKS